jgi:hypothetical protein
MRLADAAWRNVDATTIQNCWTKAGILPEMTSPSTTAQPSIPISSFIHDAHHQEDSILHAEKQVALALDNLVLTGVLQQDNRMDFEALLNPVEESLAMDEMTDQDICDAMLEANKA